MRLHSCGKKRCALIAAFAVPFILLLALWVKGLLAPLGYKLNPGERLFFDIETSSAEQADFSAAFRDADSLVENYESAVPLLAQTYHLRIRTQLMISVLDRQEDHFLVSYRFVNSSLDLKIDGRVAPYQTETVSRSLSLDIFADLDFQGRVSSLYLDPGMDRFSQNVAKFLIGGFQFALPDKRTVLKRIRSWEALEDGPNGQYKVRYEMIARATNPKAPKEGPHWKAFRKTNQGIVTMEPRRRASQGTGQKTVIPGGNLEAIFNVREGHLEWLGGTETACVLIRNKTVSQSESSLQLRFIKKEKLPPSEISRLQRQNEERRAVVKPASLSVEISEEEAGQIASRSTLGQATIESLLADLETSESKAEKKNTSLYLKFRALINLYPEVCDDLSKLLITAPPHSLTRNILTEALSTAGQPEAQEALVHVIRSCPQDPSFQNDLIQKISMVDQPSVLAENTLRDFAGDEKNQQIYATSIAGLGVMAYNLAESDSLRCDRIVDWIMAQVHPSLPESKLNLLLMSLGNSGSVRALPMLEKYLEHPSMIIRSTASAALRWIRDEKADELLVGVLNSDSESSVRDNAVFALSFRKPVQITIEAQKKALIEDTSALVRLAVLSNFWKMRQDIPELPMLLRQVAEKDPSEEVKKAAADLLVRYSQESQDHPQL